MATIDEHYNLIKAQIVALKNACKQCVIDTGFVPELEIAVNTTLEYVDGNPQVKVEPFHVRFDGFKKRGPVVVNDAETERVKEIFDRDQRAEL